ncbi:MAG: hypothetical protein KDK39_11005 [Leptospiraceae bacterium]|nr:hypothetical protein [Leptospiraceae bacterium]
MKQERQKMDQVMKKSVLFVLLLGLSCNGTWPVPVDRNDLTMEFTRIYDSIYLAHEQNYWPVNALIYTDSNGIIFFDSGWTYKSGRQLVWQAATLNQLDYLAVVPTSWHLNRSGGLSVFRASRVPILMQRKTPLLLDSKWKNAQESMKSSFSSWPVLSFESTQRIFGSKFSFQKQGIDLYHLKNGISADNVLVHFTKEKAIYAGGLFTIPIRFQDRKNPTDLLGTLDFIETLDFNSIIDGQQARVHSRQWLIKWREYIQSLSDVENGPS